MKYRDAELDSLLQWQMRFANKDYLDVVKEHKQMYEALKEIVITHNKNGLGNWKWVTKLESLLKEIEDERS